MSITLYINTAKKEKVNKKDFLITPRVISNFKFKDDTDILHPTIYLDKDTTLLNKNYCYIPTFFRYYFIDRITVLKGGIIQMELSCDVLYTHMFDILRCTAFIERSETLGNQYLNDTYFPINTKRNVHKSPVIGSFSQNLYNYIVVTGGVA